MGRLAGVEHFFTPELFEDERQDAADLRQARLQASQSDTQGDKDAISTLQSDIGRRLFERFEGRVIRRDSNSKNAAGEPIVDLPPLRIIPGLVKLTDRELNIIEARTAADLDA